MRFTKLQKSGGSVSVNLPKKELQEMGLQAGDHVVITFSAGSINIAPVYSDQTKAGRKTK